MADISIITSLYKSEKYLKRYFFFAERLQRKLRRNKIRLEIVLIANEANNFEKKIIDNYRNKTDIKVFEVPRESLYASWNRGIVESSGEIIGFWIVDDIRFAKAIVKGCEVLRTENVQIVYFSYFIIGYAIINRLRKIGNFPLPKIFLESPIEYARNEFINGMHAGPFFLFKKSVFNIVGKFDERLKIIGDYEWLVRAVLKDIVFKKVNLSSGLFFIHDSNISGSNKQRHIIELEFVYRKYSIDKSYSLTDDDMLIVQELLKNKL